MSKQHDITLRRLTVICMMSGGEKTPLEYHVIHYVTQGWASHWCFSLFGLVITQLPVQYTVKHLYVLVF